MSLQLKKKEVLDTYYTISIGYCDAYNLLSGVDRVGYTCGVYGWNSDVYIVDNIAISTGYRPFSNLDRPNGLVSKYEQKARKIREDKRYKNWETKKNKINKLLSEFIKEVREYNK